MAQAHHHHQQEQQQPSLNHRKSDVATASSSSSSSCPVDHENMSKEEITAFMPSSRSSTPPHASSSNSASNVTEKISDGTRNLESASTSDTVYDVYGQELDTSNMMPATPNQLPSPGQKTPLSTDRIQSTIPKSTASTTSNTEAKRDETWTYPSPQMFFNALRRKGKADGVEESDMATVVAVHNQMNERTWEQVVEWESRFHCDKCKNPTLTRFLGRPNDLSLAARFRMWFRGYPRPFDRHDWTVNRCGLGDITYIIDYYFVGNKHGDGNPIELHVRPAVSTMSTAFDRLRYGFLSLKSSILGVPMPLIPQLRDDLTTTRSRGIQSVSSHGMQPSTSSSAAFASPASTDKTTTTPRGEEMGNEIEDILPAVVKGDELEPEEFKFLTNLTTDTVTEISEDIHKRCRNAHESLVKAAEANDTEKAQQANMSLNYCMAQQICKKQAMGFMNALEADEGADDPSGKYGEMTDCLDRFQIMVRRAILEAAGIKQTGPEFPPGVVSSATSPGVVDAAGSATE